MAIPATGQTPWSCSRRSLSKQRRRGIAPATTDRMHPPSPTQSMSFSVNLSLALVALAGLVSPPIARAADPPLRALSQDFLLRLHDTMKGLPGPTARSIAQTSDGYLWIGTFNGLVKTDGASAVPVRLPDSGDVADDHAIDMLVDSGRSLWIATEHRLLRYTDNHWTVFDASTGFEGIQGRTLVEDPAGGIYIRCENGIFHFDGQRFEKITSPIADKEPTPLIATDSQARLHAVTLENFLRLENGAWHILESVDLPESHYTGIQRARDGGLWIATREKVRHFDGQRFSREHAIPRCSQDDYSTILEDSQGSLWLGQYYHGLVRFTPDGQTHCSFELEGLPHSHVCELMEDSEGNVWVGTGGGGALELVPIRFDVRLGDHGNYKENEIRSVSALPNGARLLATGSGSVVRVEADRITQLAPALIDYDVNMRVVLGACRDGSHWIGGDGMLRHRSLDGETDHKDVIASVGDIHCLLEDSSLRMWVGGDAGLGYFDRDGRFQVLTEPRPEVEPATTRAIAEAADGSIWVATSRGVIQLPPGSRPMRRPPEPAASVDGSNISVDTQGNVWVCRTQGGLLRIQGSQVDEFSSATGNLPPLRFSFFLDDGVGNYWAGSFAGIHRIPPERFTVDGTGPSQIDFVTYDARDGLRSTNFGSSDWPPAWIDERGLVSVASTRGLVEFDSRRFRDPTPIAATSVLIQRAIAETRSGILDLTSEFDHLHSGWVEGNASPIQLPGDTRQLTFDFSYPELAYPERVRIQYRARHEDAPWRDVPSDRRLMLSNLSTGVYTLELRASGSEGRWSERPLRIAFRIPAPWLHRPELQIVVIALLMIGTGLIGFRIQAVRLRRTRERVELERSRAAERLQAEVDRRALEAQVRQAQKLEAVGTLAGGIAHDFNNVLTAIMGHTELASLELPPESPLQQHLGNVMQSSVRARDVVQQLLTFSRRSPASLEIVDVSEVARDGMKLIRASVPKSITIETDAGDPVAVRGDRTQLHQILLNLVTNAAQAVDSPDGRIAIRVRGITVESNLTLSVGRVEPGEYVCLEVEDNGRGMDESTLERIFEPFFSTKPMGKGTGLGLSVVHGIVADHGGGIEVDSTVGEGTRFAIYLPASREIFRAPSCSVVPRARGGHQQRILLVDDEARVLSVTGWMLERLGYSIDPHWSAERALEALAAHPRGHYAAVVTDFTMPGMNGLDFANALRDRGFDRPVVIMSGNLGAIPHEALTLSGIVGWIAKPFTRNEIGLVLDKALANSGKPAAATSDEASREPSQRSATQA